MNRLCINDDCYHVLETILKSYKLNTEPNAIFYHEEKQDDN